MKGVRSRQIPIATIVVLLAAAPIGAVLAVAGSCVLWRAGYVAGSVVWGGLTGALALVMGAVAVVGARSDGLRRSFYLLLVLAALTGCESPDDVVLPSGRTVYCGGTCRVARAGEDREIGLYSRHVRRTERVIDGRLLRCDWYTLPRYRDREVVRCGWVDR